MLTFQDGTFGRIECALDLAALYRDGADRDRFEARWPAFLASDSETSQVYHRDGGTLRYSTESFVSPCADDRPSLLLMLGNPASHSVVSGICFAYEGHYGREHRFWRGLRETKLLLFSWDLSAPDCRLDWQHAARVRKQGLKHHQYESPFRVGIAVYYSMPSPASAPKWSGVAGLVRLFGLKALRRIAAEEDRRIAQLVQGFMPSGGNIMTFQKDAYEGLRSDGSPRYAMKRALQGELLGRYRGDERVLLAGAPPTRAMHWAKCRSAIQWYRDAFLQHMAVG